MLQVCGTGPDPWHWTLLLRKTTRAMFPTLKDTKQYLNILCIGLGTLFASHNKFLFKFFSESIEFSDSYRLNSSETIIKVQIWRSIKNKIMSNSFLFALERILCTTVLHSYFFILVLDTNDFGNNKKTTTSEDFSNQTFYLSNYL